MLNCARFLSVVIAVATLFAPLGQAQAQRTVKPVLHGKHWVAITGKPLAATAGALTFAQGGNAVDAACAMLAATSTMWDTLGWGGETQALIYNPKTGEVKGINALGVAPTGATVEFFRKQGMIYPPEFGPLAAVTPGTPGGLMVMLAQYGKLSLAQVLAPAMQLADGYPIEQSQADNIERQRKLIEQWPDSKRVLLPHWQKDASIRAAPKAGENFRQLDLLAMLKKLVHAEAEALAAGKSREQAIMAAYDRFYRGDIARELVRATQAQGGLITMGDLDRWKVIIEEPVKTDYRGVAVYKLTHWVQGPAMLQALNILENADLKSMGYNSSRYIHTLYQAMNMAFADRDFYYGDPYPFQNAKNPYLELLNKWTPIPPAAKALGAAGFQQAMQLSKDEAFLAGTTSIQTADAEGWVVSVTPSGGWIPAFIAGSTGVGLSQRMQSFVLDEALNPFNVVAPGKRPRATLTPSLALKGGKPFLAFSVQGGDSQDQNLLQFFLNVVEFDMNVQQAAEAANINSFQMQASFGAHVSEPGRLLVRSDVPAWVQAELRRKGYAVETEARTSGPITAIYVDQEQGGFWGAASDYGEDYGIAW